jgi:hypothetical protein
MTGILSVLTHPIGNIESAKRPTKGLGLKRHLQKQLPKIATRPEWQGILILLLPWSLNPWIACRGDCVGLACLAWYASVYVIAMIWSNARDKCALSSPWGPLGHHCHRQFGRHSNWHAHCPPWSLWRGFSTPFYLMKSLSFSPHDTLDHRVLGLHVIHGNGHDLAIHYIVYVTRLCGPFLDTLNMVKHEPHVLQISSWLNAIDKVHTTFKSVYQHLKDVDLFLSCLRKTLPWMYSIVVYLFIAMMLLKALLCHCS